MMKGKAWAFKDESLPTVATITPSIAQVILSINFKERALSPEEDIKILEGNEEVLYNLLQKVHEAIEREKEAAEKLLGNDLIEDIAIQMQFPLDPRSSD